MENSINLLNYKILLSPDIGYRRYPNYYGLQDLTDRNISRPERLPYEMSSSQLTSDDVDALSIIEAECFKDEAFYTKAEFQLMYTRDDFIAIGYREKHENKLAAAGYMNLIHESPDSGKAFIAGICVDSNYRNKGLGKQLVYDLERIAKQQGKSTVCATVRIDNTPSLRIFTNLGYSIDNIKTSFYPTEIDDGQRLSLSKKIGLSYAITEPGDKIWVPCTNMSYSCLKIFLQAGYSARYDAESQKILMSQQ